MGKSRRLVLASTSPYRRELLARLGMKFDCAAPKTDERALGGEKAPQTAERLAILKARSVRADFPDALIIGSDQVATSEGRRLDKPGVHDVAVRQLRALSGKVAEFHTAVAVLDATSN